MGKKLDSTIYLGITAIAHYSFSSLAIEAFNELLPSFFRTEKELALGFALTNLSRVSLKGKTLVFNTSQNRSKPFYFVFLHTFRRNTVPDKTVYPRFLCF